MHNVNLYINMYIYSIYVIIMLLMLTFQESLLDRQEFLQWLLDVFEKGKASDDVLLKYLIPLVLRVCLMLNLTDL